MKLIHLTDLHLMPPGELLWGLDPFARFDAALNDIAAHHADADLCVITGDLTEKGDIAAYELLKERLARFPIRTQLLLGNHDDRANYLKVFGGADATGHVQHVMEQDGRYLFFLDTLKGPPSSAGLYDVPRQAWLNAELDRIDGSPVYLFMHHPPFDIGHPLMDLIKLDDAEEFADILIGHDVRHIFFGHAHRTISGSWNGIAFSALPSLNHQLPLVGGSVETVYSDEPPMYAVVTIADTMTLVHADAFLHRRPADMQKDAERGNWY
jgi:3',5'-cyclic-AMP phosphodiesterase